MEKKDNQTVNQSICQYLQDGIFLTAYQLGLQDKENRFMFDDSKLRNQLRIDTLKCMGVTSVLFLGYTFSKGRNHYLNYIKTLLKGSLTGFTISIYYTREKMRDHMINKYLEKSSPKQPK